MGIVKLLETKFEDSDKNLKRKEITISLLLKTNNKELKNINYKNKMLLNEFINKVKKDKNNNLYIEIVQVEEEKDLISSLVVKKYNFGIDFYKAKKFYQKKLNNNYKKSEIKRMIFNLK